jgi:hypothetical protein
MKDAAAYFLLLLRVWRNRYLKIRCELHYAIVILNETYVALNPLLLVISKCLKI